MNAYRLYHLIVCALQVAVIPRYVAVVRPEGWQLWFFTVLFWYSCFLIGWALGDLAKWLVRHGKARATPDLYALIDNKVVSE